MSEPMPDLDALRARGAMTWVNEERAWRAHPDDVVDALSNGGFQEYKRESIRSGHDREPTGGVWQGLNESTGAVASAVWVCRNDDEAAHEVATVGRGALVFIDIDGERVTGH